MSSFSSVSDPHTSEKPSHTDLFKRQRNVYVMHLFLSWTATQLSMDWQGLISFTWCTSYIHGLKIASLYHGDGQSACCRQVAEGEHQIPKVHVILKDIRDTFTLTSVWIFVCYSSLHWSQSWGRTAGVSWLLLSVLFVLLFFFFIKNRVLCLAQIKPSHISARMHSSA